LQRCLEAVLLLGMLGAVGACQAQIVSLTPVGLRNSELAQDADGDGVPDYWRARTIPPGAGIAWQLEGTHGPSGKPVLRATVPAGVRTELFQRFEVRSGTGYSAGCRMQREIGGRAECQVYLRWLDGEGKELGQSQRRSHELPLEGWAELVASGYAPDNATQAAVVIAVRATDAVEIRLSDALAGEGLGPTPLLDNGGFEAHENLRVFADGWRRTARRIGVEVERDASHAHTGGAAARLSVSENAQGYAGVEQISPPLKPFDAVRLSFWYAGTGGLSTGMVRFLDASESAREYGRRYFEQDTPQRDWRERIVEVATPAEARQAEAIRIEVSLYQRKPGEVWYDDVKLEALATWTPRIEPPISALQTPVRPADGATVKQTPPDFSWTPQPEAVSYDLQLARSPDFPEASAVSVAGLPYNCYSHHQVLGPGRWHWRYRYSLAKGEVSEWSPAMSFVVAADAAEFPVPPVDELIGRVPTEHPRVLFNSESLAQVRERINSQQGEWLARLQAECEALVGEQLEAEPGEAWDFSKLRGNITPAIKQRRDRLYDREAAPAGACVSAD